MVGMAGVEPAFVGSMYLRAAITVYALHANG